VRSASGTNAKVEWTETASPGFGTPPPGGQLAAIAERSRPKGLVVAEPFRVRITVRGYEIDAQGHLSGVVYLQYGEHARWECLRAAGILQHKLAAGGVGPVQLETSIRFHRELRAGDAVDVSCVFVWGDGKTFRVEQDFRRPDGTLVAELANVGGLLNLKQRRLVADPAGQFRSLATAPEVLGL
jgi:acyl-CoA thioester hydrolase